MLLPSKVLNKYQDNGQHNKFSNQKKTYIMFGFKKVRKKEKNVKECNFLMFGFTRKKKLFKS